MSETAVDGRELEVSRDLGQAERDLQEVHERIKDGDEGTGPEDLEAAEARVRFARARIEGLKRRKEEEAEQARKDRIEALEERALALDPGAVRKLEEKARKALDAYVEAAVAYRTELTGIVQELSALGPLPEDLELDTTPDHYGLAAGPERRAPINPVAVCTVIAHEVLRTHMPPRHQIDLSISKYG